MKIKWKADSVLFGGGIGALVFCQSYVWMLNRYINPIWYILCFALLAFMYVQMWKVPPKSRDIMMGGAFSMIVSMVFVVGKKISFNNDVFGSYTVNFIYPLTMKDWVGVLCWMPLVFVVVYGLCCIAKKYSCSVQEQQLSKKESVFIWLLLSGFIMICWLPYLFAYYPGVVVGDSIASINQALNKTPYTNHYPVMYTLFIKLFLEIGGLTGSYNRGVFLYSCVQYTLMAASAGYCVHWMLRKKIPWILAMMAELYFAFTRIFAVYAISMWKDPLFSAALLLFCLLLLDIGISRGRNLKETKVIATFISLGCMIVFLRNNGIYLVVGISVILAIVYRKQFMKLGTRVLTMILMCMLIQGPIYDAMGVGKDTVAESLGVPIQQLASVIVKDRELTEEQRQVLFQVLPEAQWKAFYTPAIVDSLKFHGEFNQQYLEENVGEFLKVWLQLLFPNLDVYVEAYLMDTIGFWQIGLKNSAGFYYFYVDENNDFNIQRVDMAERLLGVPLEDELMWWVTYMSTGALVWLVLLGGLLTWMQEKYALLLGFFPPVLLWLTIMVATPIAFSLRYIYLLAYGLPLFLLLPFLRVETEAEEIITKEIKENE